MVSIWAASGVSTRVGAGGRASPLASTRRHRYPADVSAAVAVGYRVGKAGLSVHLPDDVYRGAVHLHDADDIAARLRQQICCAL